jgi:membrane-associated phospholipid phosphatase
MHPGGTPSTSTTVEVGTGRDGQAWLEPPREALLGGGRFGGLAALGLVVVIVGAVPFLTLLALVEASWTPLRRLDIGVAEGLNAWLAASPGWLPPTEIASELGGGATATVVLSLAAVWLLIRRQPRLAAYVVVTGLGLAVLVPVSKALIGRTRPDVAIPLVELPTNASFPSGHAMTSLVTWGLLLLVAWPRVRRRGVLLTSVAMLVLLVGATRLVLGVHFVTDVLAGWALGAAWLAVTTGAFHRWLSYRHDRLHTADQAVPYSSGLRLAPVDEPVLAAGARGWGTVLGAAVLIAVVLVGLGLLVTGTPLDGAPARWDRWVGDQLLVLRSDHPTALALALGALGGLRAMVTVATAAAVVALAYRGSWRPAVFVALVVVGAVAIYAAVSQVVGRARPEVATLAEGLPAAASFPSGHVAAAFAIYGAAATLLITYARGWWRWLALPVVAVVLAVVAASRLYMAAHSPTDILGGLLLGAVWLAVLARLVLGLPLRDRPGSWVSVLHPPVVPSLPADQTARTSST